MIHRFARALFAVLVAGATFASLTETPCSAFPAVSETSENMAIQPAEQQPQTQPQQPQRQTPPGAPQEPAGPLGEQFNSLDDVRAGFFRLLQTTPYSAQYAILETMQEESNRADEAFARGYASSVGEDFVTANVTIHAFLAIGAAVLKYEELYERHLDVCYERIRRRTGQSGQTAEARFAEILRNQPSGLGGSLWGAFCEYAGSELCRRPEPTRFQSYLASAGDPVEIVFDRGPNFNPDDFLSRFAISVLSPGEDSPNSQDFANKLDHQLENPLVRHWYIQEYLDETLQVPAIKSPAEGEAQIFAQKSRIDVDASDFFVPDPADQQKLAWVDYVRTLIAGRQRITWKMRVPNGNYYVHPRGMRPPPGTTPNLVVAGAPCPGGARYVFQMSASGTSVSVSRSCPDDGWKFEPEFYLVRFDLGANSETDTFEGTAEGRLFNRFSRNLAVQTQFQAAFRSHRDRLDLNDVLPGFVDPFDRPFDNFSTREFQLDVGPVVRIGNLQFAAMESIRWVDRETWDQRGTVGQFFFNVNYLFSRGQVGGYVTRANMDEPVVHSVQFDTVLFEETFLKVIDQYGVNFDVQVGRNISVEGAFGYLDSTIRDNVVGGTVRVSLPPFWNRVRATAEFGFNESFVAQEDAWRFGFGLRFGDWGPDSSPANFRGHDGPVPVYVPRVRYEALRRIVRRGNRAPIANAGPDQRDLPPFTRVVLDGTDSFDPDGDTITFLWTLQGDCDENIQLDDRTSPTPSLVIGNGDTCTVQLVVTDSFGLPSEPDAVVVSSVRVERPNVVFFRVEPAEIRQGQTATVSWEVLNAVTISISNLTDVSAPDDLPAGQRTVGPDDTTTYVLTACNQVNECATAEATLLVRPGLPEILSFTATPPEIRIGTGDIVCPAGQAGSLLEWETAGATIVTLTNAQGGSDRVEPNGSQTVCLSQTTTFTLTATNDRGELVSAEVTVVVLPVIPEILSFTATPADIRIGDEPAPGAPECPPGQAGTLLEWDVIGATRVVLTNDGGFSQPVPLQGRLQICLSQTTTFTLTATNDAGERAFAETTVLVRPPLPRILSFTATPDEIRPDDTDGSLLEWTTINADRVFIDNIPGNPDLAPNGSVRVRPEVTTTYTLTATNNQGEFVEAQVTVLVRGDLPEVVSFTANPPILRVPEGGSADTLLNWVTLGASIVNITNVPGDPTLPPEGQVTVTLSETTTFTLTATNDRGEFATAELTVEVLPLLPAILSFTATPTQVRLGLPPQPGDIMCPDDQAGTLLEWQVRGVDTGGAVRLTNAGSPVEVPPSGSREVCLDQTTTFVLTATNSLGESASADVTVTVLPAQPEVLSFTATPSTIRSAGNADGTATPVETSRLAWTTRNANRVILSSSLGENFLVEENGSMDVQPVMTTTYTLTAFGDSGQSDSVSVIVNVNVVAPPVINSFEANPSMISAGGSSTLSWSTTGAVRVEISGTDGTNVADAPNGMRIVMPSSTTTYSLTAFDELGRSVTSGPVTVTVTP